MAKKNNQKRRLILDTSTQIERIKFDNFNTKIVQLTSSCDLYTLNFVYYEYKVGIILSLIDFYHTVEAYNDVSHAYMKWSDRIGRDPKYNAINQGLLARVNKSIKFDDVQEYLSKLETIIVYLLQHFDMNIKDRIGDFANDPIVKFDLYDCSTYRDFLNLYGSRKTIPLVDFWKKNHDALLQLIDSHLLKKDYDTFHSRLEKIRDDIEKANNYWVNKTTGDAVIATDTPKKYIITTTDNIYKHLSTALGKEFLLLKKLD